MGTFEVNLLTVAAVGMVMAGCQSSRMDPRLDRARATSGRSLRRCQPEPACRHPAVPQTSSLTAPTTGGAAPGTQGNTQVAAVPTGKRSGPYGQQCRRRLECIDGWTVAARFATPQTKFGQGYRAGPPRCPGELANLSSWAVSGKQLVLYDAAGGAVARLYSSAPSKFDGQTSGGQNL